MAPSGNRSADGAESRRYRHDELFDYGCRTCSTSSTACGSPMHESVSACLIKAELRKIIPTGWCGCLCNGGVQDPRVGDGPICGCGRRGPRRQWSTAITGSAQSWGRERCGWRSISRAPRGPGFVGARHSNHFGPATYCVEKAISAGYIGLAISNAPPNMARLGGAHAFPGHQPCQRWASPAGQEPADLRCVNRRGRARPDHRRGAHGRGGFRTAGPSIPTDTRRRIRNGRSRARCLPFGHPENGNLLHYPALPFYSILTSVIGARWTRWKIESKRPERRSRAGGRAHRPVRGATRSWDGRN